MGCDRQDSGGSLRKAFFLLWEPERRGETDLQAGRQRAHTCAGAEVLQEGLGQASARGGGVGRSGVSSGELRGTGREATGKGEPGVAVTEGWENGGDVLAGWDGGCWWSRRPGL